MRGRYRPYYEERSSRSSLCCTAAFQHIRHSNREPVFINTKLRNLKWSEKWKQKWLLLVLYVMFDCLKSVILERFISTHAWNSSQIKCVTINRKNNPLNMEILWKVISVIDQMVSKAKIYSEIYALTDIILIQGRQYTTMTSAWGVHCTYTVHLYSRQSRDAVRPNVWDWHMSRLQGTLLVIIISY